ncbi:hypothetical protein M9Y10_025951 [Tritrichomonas musculus]|uniref:BTB domain-containing protein n=1 Tax=Tritrichomonas musculus TaxID=1915356 RepID=A0ABR2H8W5_9EUKA
MIDQGFPVHYQNRIFMVNPALLYNSSRKFRDLVDHSVDINSIRLNINCDIFSVRNIENFLKICQNLPTDVQNSELEEICLIAKMFQADKIYDTGLNFIQTNMNPSFVIPDNQFNESGSDHYLELELDSKKVPCHHVNLDELEFEESSESILSRNEKEKENINNEIKKNNDDLKSSNGIHVHTVCYQITSDNHFMKCPRYYLVKDGKTVCMAKFKDDELYIGEGDDFRISENRVENVARVYRNRAGCNVIQTNDQDIKIKFIPNGDRYSISLSFFHEGRKMNWTPRKPNSLANYKGAYKHIPIASKRNLILQNSSNQCTFIVRKMSKKIFEVECNPKVRPIIVFAIALSDIIGPLSIQY